MLDLLAPIDPSQMQPPPLPEEVPPIAHIALGLMLGLLGWPLYSGVVRLAGALLGLALGLAAVLVANELQPLGEGLTITLVICATIGALLGAIVIGRLEPLAWLLLGGSLGVLSVWTFRLRLVEQMQTESWLMQAEPWPRGAQIAALVGAAIVVGLLAIWLRRWLIMAVTAALGAGLIAPHLEALGPPMAAWWGVGTLAFFLAQAGLDHMMRVGGQQPEVAEGPN